ncbi:MAG: tRNA (N6-threonylcarbamoyladenosine(37)-N6)-methyltransferase TrmO [Opitutaceae bacterium]|nr:tRNA (N6-threonylcarbamoyladenosine(37)-N6)-methyltransferase TrmO [Opitutaceae bacterium]
MKTPRPDPLEAFTLAPIGVVDSPYQTFVDGCDYQSESRIVLRPELEAGLVGIEYFSHLWVIYRQHRSAEWLRARGWGDAPPLVLPAEDDRAGQGVFSSRAPCRPAALGSCIVSLLRREKNVIVVRGLDAFHRTPVVDVKPYVPHFDAFPDAAVPLHWAKVMERPDDAARASREMHWDTSNVDFALGLRVGVAALRRLGVARGVPLRAELAGSTFFAHGFEMATGCSPLRATLVHTPRSASEVPWTVRLFHGEQVLDYRLARVAWPDAASILAAVENALWSETAVGADFAGTP